MKKPLLSVSILCSGRKETEKCLKSLETLRSRVDCELILVDTGCDKEMRRLIEGYADRIIPFTWANDFSRARNAGLKEATGEWFLFLDDDEWFPDTEAIEEFFLSGAYKAYGYANYIQRNYSDAEGIDYEDVWVTRLAPLGNGLRFKGVVHEIFEPLSPPYKLLPCVAEHYGYAYQTEEEARKHAERNIKLLEKAMREEPDNLRNWTHLAQEYLASKMYRELGEFCADALKKLAGKNDAATNRERGCFYCGLVEAEMNLEQYKEAGIAYERAAADKRNTDYCIARLLFFGAGLYERQRNDKKVGECCERYFALWEEYEKKPDELYGQQTNLVNMAFHYAYRSLMCSYQICVDLRGGNTDFLKKYFDELGWEKEQVYIIENFVPCLVEAMAKLSFEEIFAHAANVILNRPGAELFLDEIKKVENQDGISRLWRIFSEVTVPSFERFEEIADYCLKDASVRKIRNLEKVSGAMERGSVRRDYFCMKLSEAGAFCIGRDDDGASGGGVSCKQEMDYIALTKLLASHVKTCFDFYGNFFKEKAFEGEMAFLPNSGRAAVKLREMLEAAENDNWEMFSKALKEVVNIYPESGGTLKKYAGLYAERRISKQEEQEKRTVKGEKNADAGAPSQGVSAEMQALAAQIKAQIPLLLSQGMTEQAKQIIEQLKMLVPEDEEIEKLEKK